MLPNSQILDLLSSDSIMGLIPGGEHFFAERASILHLAPGELVVKAGEPLLRLFIPLNNHIVLERESAGGREHVGYLQKGRSLCLKELMAHDKAPYTARAEFQTTVLSLSRSDFLELLAKDNRVEHYLTLMTTSAGARSFKNFLMEAGVARNDVITFVRRISADQSTAPAGSQLQPAEPCVVLLDDGHVKLTRRGGGKDDVICELGQGAWFGGEAIVPPHLLGYESVAVEATVYRTIPVSELVALADRFHITERIANDPWIGSGIQHRDVQRAQTLSALPGARIPPAEYEKYGITLDPNKLYACANDGESVVASACNVVAILGLDASFANIKRELELRPSVTLVGVAESLEPYGVMTLALESTLAELPRLQLPALVRFGARIVVLVKADARSVLLADPARGFVLVNMADFDRLWDKRSLEVTKAETDLLITSPAAKTAQSKEAGPAPANYQFATLVFRMLLPFRGILVSSGVLACLAMLLGYVQPLVMQYLVDEVLSLRDLGTIYTLMVASILLMVLGIVLSVCQNYVALEFSQRFGERAASLFYRYSFSTRNILDSKQRVGDFQAREGEYHTVVDFITHAPTGLGISVLSALFYSAILCTYSPAIATIPVGAMVAVAAIRIPFARRMRRRYLDLFELGKLRSSMISEHLAAMATVKAAGADVLLRDRLMDLITEETDLGRRLSLEQSTVNVLVGLVTSVAGVGCLWLALRASTTGELSVGQVVAVNTYAGSLIGALVGISEMFSTIEHIKVALKRSTEWLSAPREDGGERFRHSRLLKGKIKLDRVNFRYSANDPWVLRDTCLTIYPNQVVAIVGRSGCGKTTLANLVAGNLTPTGGKIYFDDHDSTLITPRSLRAQIGFINQENRLFSMSIGENIQYADDVPRDDQLVRAAMQSNSLDFIQALPGQFKYFLSDGGIGVSGGQRQRISIARTLYREPTILLMDEATSALDSESEAEVMNRLQDMRAGRTVVIIAHRLATVRHADRIIVLKEGEVVGDGSHWRLIASCEHYKELFAGQISAGVA